MSDKPNSMSMFASSSDFWKAEAQRYAQNTDHWREKYEAAFARIAELEAQAKADAEDAARLLALLIRYRNETPLGHQPHMIAHEADAAIDAARERVEEFHRGFKMAATARKDKP